MATLELHYCYCCCALKQNTVYKQIQLYRKCFIIYLLIRHILIFCPTVLPLPPEWSILRSSDVSGHKCSVSLFYWLPHQYVSTSPLFEGQIQAILYTQFQLSHEERNSKKTAGAYAMHKNTLVSKPAVRYRHRYLIYIISNLPLEICEEQGKNST